MFNVCQQNARGVKITRAGAKSGLANRFTAVLNTWLLVYTSTLRDVITTPLVFILTLLGAMFKS